jgi:hypothetical protein
MVYVFDIQWRLEQEYDCLHEQHMLNSVEYDSWATSTALESYGTALYAPSRDHSCY